MNELNQGNHPGYLVEVHNMYKNFGATVALNDVDLYLSAGEIRGLIGENGSGKSTVSSIISGMQPPTSGTMVYQGQPYAPVDTIEASEKGIEMVVQEAGTISGISVAENIFLGHEKEFRVRGMISKRQMVEKAKEALTKIGVTGIDPALPIDMLDMQDRKLVEVARATVTDPQVLIIDETTTALSQTGRSILYDLIADYASQGKGVLFISHDLEELIKTCTHLTVLRDGKIICNLEKEQFDENRIKSHMVGREISGHYYRNDFDGYDKNEVVLTCEGITTLESVTNLDLTLHRGEILGIGGLSHCGMHAVGRAMYGLEKLLTGQVKVGDKPIKSSMEAMKYGLGYVSKNRDTESLALDASVHDNIASSGYDKNIVGKIFISRSKEKRYVRKEIDDLSIKCAYPGQPVRFLSGGNKQKVVFGKWIGRDSDILILDCPTRGVDIGVKQAMYQLIYAMKKSGKAIVIISEELPELIGMCDRLLIMKDGRIEKEFMREASLCEADVIDYMI